VIATGSAPALELHRQVLEARLEVPELVGRFDRLLAIVADIDSCVLALSGGIDSSLMLEVASRILGSRCVAVTAESAALPAWDRADAERAGVTAESHGASWRVIETRELEDSRYAANSRSRCFYCKSEVYGRLAEIARETGLACVIDGTNATDAASSDRPGMAAGATLGVRSPLAESGLTKDDVRTLAQALGMIDWDRPSSACLSSRIPHGVRITPELLRRVEEAELGVRGLGFSQVRVRHLGDTARVEVDRSEVDRLHASRVGVDLVIRAAGFAAWTSAEYVGHGAGEIGDVPG